MPTAKVFIFQLSSELVLLHPEEQLSSPSERCSFETLTYAEATNARINSGGTWSQPQALSHVTEIH